MCYMSRARPRSTRSQFCTERCEFEHVRNSASTTNLAPPVSALDSHVIRLPTTLARATRSRSDTRIIIIDFLPRSFWTVGGHEKRNRFAGKIMFCHRVVSTSRIRSDSNGSTRTRAVLLNRPILRYVSTSTTIVNIFRSIKSCDVIFDFSCLSAVCI